MLVNLWILHYCIKGMEATDVNRQELEKKASSDELLQHSLKIKEKISELYK